MAFRAPPEPVLPAAWTEVLDEIQQALAEALRMLDKRAEALEAIKLPEPGSVASRTEAACVPLLTQEPIESSEVRIAEVEQHVTAAQETLDRWLASAAQAAQRLAEQAVRSV
jgi:hypothetical protein